jgi:hypothetical protein
VATDNAMSAFMAVSSSPRVLAYPLSVCAETAQRVGALFH